MKSHIVERVLVQHEASSNQSLQVLASGSLGSLHKQQHQQRQSSIRAATSTQPSPCLPLGGLTRCPAQLYGGCLARKTAGSPAS
eukprot:948324-Pelagomonas_calceolata.AAC.4